METTRKSSNIALKEHLEVFCSDCETRTHEDQKQTLLEVIDVLATMAKGSKGGGASSCDTNVLKQATRLCTNKNFKEIYGVSLPTEDIIDAITNTSLSREDRMAWLRALVAIQTTEKEKKICIDKLNQREKRTVLMPAIAKEADTEPTRELMGWYELMLEEDLEWKDKAEMYNRLAYFHLSDHDAKTAQWDHIERAKVYFLAMERKGIPLNNPYLGYFGESNHDKAVYAVRSDTYKRNEMQYLSEYALGLQRRIIGRGIEGRIEYVDTMPDFWFAEISDRDCCDLRNVMTGMYLVLDRGCSKPEKKIWKDFLSEYCSSLKVLLSKQDEGDEHKETARFLIHLLFYYDNWLFSAYEGTPEEELQLKCWLQLVKRISGKHEAVILDGIYNRLIKLLLSNINSSSRKESYSLLEEKVRTVDTAAQLVKTGLDNALDFYNKIYCTEDCMAFLWLCAKEGRLNDIEMIAEEIKENDSAVENDIPYLFDQNEELFYLKYKYNNLLEEIGLDKQKYGLEIPSSDDEESSIIIMFLEAEDSYRKKQYQNAITYIDGIRGYIKEPGAADRMDVDAIREKCDRYESMIKHVLKPNTSGEGTQTVTPRRIVSINQYGVFTVTIDEEKWRNHYATMDDMSRLLKDGTTKPSDYYMLEYVYIPKCDTSDYNEHQLDSKRIES